MTDQQTHPYPPTDPPSAGRSSRSADPDAPSTDPHAPSAGVDAPAADPNAPSARSGDEPSGPSSDAPSARSGDEPDRVVSDPVPVPPPGDGLGASTAADYGSASAAAGPLTTKGDESDNAPGAVSPLAADASPAEDVTDRVPDEVLEDRGTFEDPVVVGERTDPDDLTAVSRDEEPEFHEPAPQPTAFGAATVAGAAAAAAMAGPSREVSDAERDDAGLDGVNLDGVDRDSVDRDSVDRDDAGRDGAFRVTTPEDQADRVTTADEADRADRPTLAAPATPADVEPDRAALADTELDRPGVVTDQEPDRTRAAETPAEDEPVAEPRTELLPGEVPAEPVTALWGDDTAQSFRDRWRDVQLRFVDDPRGAAQEAKELVADAVDSLTSALASQRDELGRWVDEEGSDTERFRVVVRQYRDFLDRLLGL